MDIDKSRQIQWLLTVKYLRFAKAVAIAVPNDKKAHQHLQAVKYWVNFNAQGVPCTLHKVVKFPPRILPVIVDTVASAL